VITRSWLGRIGTVAMVVTSGGWLAPTATTQTPAMALAAPPSQGVGEIALDPISCWWKTATNAVHLGEHFTLTLTCGLADTGRVTVVPDVKSLEPTTVQLAPFEVVRGVRHQDIHIQESPWRYVQYEYTLRLLGEGYFGRDVDIPSINVTYNIQSPGGETQGRDQVYVLPALPMRIISLAPLKATDIRDTPRDSFADIEARRFRATAELIAAGIFFGFAVVLLGFAVTRIANRHRQHAPVAARPIRSRAVLAGCQRALGRLKSNVAHTGWTPELAARALAVVRIAAAVALGRPLAQTLVDSNVPRQDGQIVLRKGMLRRALISAPTTQDSFAIQPGTGNGPGPRARVVIEELRESLQTFSATCYGRADHLDTTALDSALDNGMRAIQRLRFMKRWPMSTAAKLSKSAAWLREIVWARSESF
jgi:hypothetical protein